MKTKGAIKAVLKQYCWNGDSKRHLQAVELADYLYKHDPDCLARYSPDLWLSFNLAEEMRKEIDNKILKDIQDIHDNYLRSKAGSTLR